VLVSAFQQSYFLMLQGLDDLNVEDDTKDLINREIRSFRNLHKVRK